MTAPGEGTMAGSQASRAALITGTVIAVDGGQHTAWRSLDSDVAE